tara:strand:- start:505 stop:759 length:255 start_codon:yes stop_codon:yes gene_type:complete
MHTSVNRFTPLIKRFIISISLILSVLLMGGFEVEAQTQISTPSSTIGVCIVNYGQASNCFCETSTGTVVLLNCSGVDPSFNGVL